jgi:hypothetical protein
MRINPEDIIAACALVFTGFLVGFAIVVIGWALL